MRGGRTTSVKSKALGCALAAVASGFLIALVLLACIYWPVVFAPAYTLPIEGRVIDEVTGQPVGKVLVTSEWNYFSHIAFDTSLVSESHRTVTDENGRYSVPRWKIIHPWKGFAFQQIRMRHPLYDPLVLRVSSDAARSSVRPAPGEHEAGKPAVRSGIAYLVGSISDERLRLVTTITKLEDKYVNPAGNLGLVRVLSTITPEFFQLLKADFGVDYDLPSITAKWETLAGRFPVEGNREYEILRSEYESLALRFRESKQ